MSYHQKRAIVSIATGFALLAAYALIVSRRMNAGLLATGDLRGWAAVMLVFVGVGIAASIVIQIVFHILLSIGLAVREKMEKGECPDGTIERAIESEMVEDEMNKLITLKSSRVSFGVAGGGFFAALVCLVCDLSPVLSLNILYAAFSLGAVAEGFAQLRYYKKGLR